ncbi:MAG: hypothetical protein F6K28_10970 [Microcoleus sp. SIO2G3]|nr:hypothetical protein [Microcoleus sp. SIO2G3]
MRQRPLDGFPTEATAFALGVPKAYPKGDAENGRRGEVDLCPPTVFDHTPEQ